MVQDMAVTETFSTEWMIVGVMPSADTIHDRVCRDDVAALLRRK